MPRKKMNFSAKERQKSFRALVGPESFPHFGYVRMAVFNANEYGMKSVL